jgi:hypothetical protein
MFESNEDSAPKTQTGLQAIAQAKIKKRNEKQIPFSPDNLIDFKNSGLNKLRIALTVDRQLKQIENQRVLPNL